MSIPSLTPVQELSAAERFSSVVQQSGPRVLGYLGRRVSPREDAADLLSEVLVTAWRRVSDLPAEDDEALAWLIGIARQTLRNHSRSQRRRTALTDKLRDHVRAAPAADDAAARRVTSAMLKLDDADRDILRMAVWDELTGDQIAMVLGISAAAARQRLSRAKQRLKEALAG